MILMLYSQGAKSCDSSCGQYADLFLQYRESEVWQMEQSKGVMVRMIKMLVLSRY